MHPIHVSVFWVIRGRATDARGKWVVWGAGEVRVAESAGNGNKINIEMCTTPCRGRRRGGGDERGHAFSVIHRVAAWGSFNPVNNIATWFVIS